MRELVVIAIGGNSLIRDSQHMTVLDQYRACGETSKHIAGIIERGYRGIITHGNGPQVGFILLRSELAKGREEMAKEDPDPVAARSEAKKIALGKFDKRPVLSLPRLPQHKRRH